MAGCLTKLFFGICNGHENKQYPATLTSRWANNGIFIYVWDCFPVGKNCVQGNEATTPISFLFHGFLLQFSLTGWYKWLLQKIWPF